LNWLSASPTNEPISRAGSASYSAINRAIGEAVIRDS
jgi:hypothetical protein